jgi:hypothetical protein
MELFRHCFDIVAFGRHETSIFVRPKPEPPLYCSKRPQDILFVHPLLRLDPNLWVVFMIRDPRDVIVSRHKPRPEEYWCHLGVWKNRYRKARASWQHPRFVVIRYEDLVGEPDAVQEQLEARMPFLRRTRSFSEWGTRDRVSERSELALGGVRPITEDSVGAWRGKTGRVASQLRKHGPITDELVDLGYESDGAWLASVEDAAPDERPTVYAEPTRAQPGLSGLASAIATSLRFHGARVLNTARYAFRASRRVALDES